MKATGKGYLFKRGKYFYLQYDINGERKTIALKDKDEKPVTAKKAAEEMRDTILSPYRSKNRLEIRKQALQALKTEEEAENHAAKEADDILNPALTLDKAWNAYVLNQERPQKSGAQNMQNYASYFQKLHTWIKDTHPDITRLKEVTKEIASEYSLFLKQSKLSAGTFNKYRDFLKIFFHYLSKHAKMADNPFEGITRLNDTPNSRRALTADEIRIIIQRSAGDLQLLLMLGAFTGLRLGDCCTLQWHEIDLDTKSIERIPNKTAQNKKAVTVGIPDTLYFKLMEFPKAERKAYLFPELAERYNGTNRQSIPKTIQKHFTDCGIITHKVGTGQGTGKKAVLEIGFHSLRHSYISLHAKSGTSQNILTKLAGHSSEMSEHYTHIQPEEAHAISQSVFKGFLGAADDAITVKPLSVPTEAERRINKALDYIKSCSISEAEKQNLLSILER